MDNLINTYVCKEDGMNADLVEKSDAYLKVVKEVDEEAKKEVRDLGREGQMGSCHIFWGSKKQILKKKHNIDWRTPAELNEMVMFD
ncbi:MAG: hypothetical protein WCO48_03060 [Candidatus Taylorbacteria bacterium]